MEDAKKYLEHHKNCKGLYFNQDGSWHFVNHGSHADGEFMSREEILGEEKKPKKSKNNDK